MNLDFFLQEEPLDKLVPSYIEIEIRESASNIRQRASREIVILNSILVNLASQKQGLKTLLTEVKYCLQVNENDRKCQERAAVLVFEVIKRSRQVFVHASRQTVNEVVSFACQKAFIAVCGNAYISLLNQICSIIDLELHKEVFVQIINFLINPKLLVSTYRQQTRLCLYRLYLKTLTFQDKNSLEGFDKQQNKSLLLEKCINGGSGEKDPRNIGSVFELYLKILSLFPEKELEKYRSVMFENLESYYPIEFVGDEDNDEHQKINVKQISALLDQCLTHRFFNSQAWELFSTKTAAPPIAPFVSTFLLYLSKRRADSEYDFLASRLKNLLVRLCEEEFIEEDYPNNEPNLGNVYVGILDFLFCKVDGSFSISAYETVMNWLQKMVDKVIIGNCKHSGTMMGIFRCLVNNSSVSRFKTLVELFRNYALRKVIKVLRNQDDIIPKLGLAIVALSQNRFATSELQQIVGLLILKVGKLYEVVNDQIKMLLLKILLEAYRGYPNNRLMIRTTNDSLVLKDCLSRAKWAFSNPLDPTQSYIIKAFIDFISTVYLNKLQSFLQNITGSNYELETYLMGRLLQVLDRQEQNGQKEVKKRFILERFSILANNLKHQKQKEEILTALRAINFRCCCYLMSFSEWPKNRQTAKLLISLIIELRQHFQQTNQEDDLGDLDNNESNIVLTYLQNTQNTGEKQTLLQKLWIQLTGDRETIAFPNLSQIHILDLNSFCFESAFSKGYEPTLVHFLWQHLNSIESEQLRQKNAATLLQYLPERLLLRDSERILKILLKNDQQGSSLLKIVNHMDISTLEKTGIVQYCLQYVLELSNEKPEFHKNTPRSVCILAVLIAILEKDKEGKLKEALMKMKKQWKKLLMSRKRAIRQAVRRILLMLQE